MEKLSNIQKELLKIYNIGINDNDLLELKDLLAKFFAEKASEEMNLMKTNVI